MERCNVIISKKGLNLLKKIDKLDKELDDKLSQLNGKEARDLNSLLDKLRT